MTFREREEFKQGLVNFGLVMKRHTVFLKDVKNRIRAECSCLVAHEYFIILINQNLTGSTSRHIFLNIDVLKVCVTHQLLWLSNMGM
jgi:hypothetical protein